STTMPDVNVGTIYGRVAIEGTEQVQEGFRQLNEQTEKTQTQIQQSTGKIQNSFAEMGRMLVNQLMAIGGAFVSVQQLVKGFQDVMGEELAYRRLELNLDRLGISFADNQQKIRDWVDQWRLFATGIEEEKLLTGLRRLIPIFGDLTTAMNVASVAMSISAQTGSDYGQVISLLTRLYQGLRVRGNELSEVFNLNVAGLRKVNDATGEMSAMLIDAQKALEAISAAYTGEKGKAGLLKVLDTAAMETARWKAELSELRETLAQPVLTVLLYLARGLKAIGETLGLVSLMFEEWGRMVVNTFGAVLRTLRTFIGSIRNYFATLAEFLRNPLKALADFSDELRFQLEYGDVNRSLERMEYYARRIGEAIKEAFSPEIKVPEYPPLPPVKATPLEQKQEEAEKKERIKQEHQKEAEEYEKVEKMKQDATEKVADSILSIWERLFMEGKLTWEELGRTIKGVIWDIVREILRSQILKLLAQIAGAFGKTSAPEFYTPPGELPPGGTPTWVASPNLPPVPEGGGGITVNISGSPEGVLVKVYDGMTQREKSILARNIYLLGAHSAQVSG
ncbi:hypothetical protein, partial [Thermogutta sp.]|uniref:hypothetical protein n=1 Tax=Thermogutta sp. TaxID=1962930 RepID=UPI00322075C8